jgi:hypothetical protein
MILPIPIITQNTVQGGQKVSLGPFAQQGTNVDD